MFFEKLFLFTLCSGFSLAFYSNRIQVNANKPHHEHQTGKPFHHLSDRHYIDANDIINYFTKGKGKSQTYSWLAHLCDTYGNRYAPGPQFDAAASYLVEALRDIGVDSVWTEEAAGIPHWFRSQDPSNPDMAVLISPRSHIIPVLALGNSTATPGNGGFKNVKAIVVRSFDELSSLPDSAVNGSIVVYNQDWGGSYGASVIYRGHGATEAAKRGAIAALVRSVTPQSLYTLHTGWNDYVTNDSRLQIPVGSITVEDAELLWRMQQSGQQLIMSLQINTVNYGYVSKPNIIAEIKGSQYPDEMVLFGGHLDSWDVGQGAMDDGGGVAITFQALKAVIDLGLKPKRTLRAVFWTGEEFDYVGSAAYYNAHKQEAPKISLVMESDSGTFSPQGFHYAGNKQAQAILQQVMQLLSPLNATQLITDGTEPGDPEPFVDNDGVPGVELKTAADKYFWYHHTDADTMTLHNSTDLDACAAVWATMAVSVANLDSLLPHGH